MTEPLIAQTVAVLSRGHSLFVGGVAAAPIGAGPAQLILRADAISPTMSATGLPAAAVARSDAAMRRLGRFSDTDRALAQIVTAARTERAHASRATRSILEAAKADTMPAADTPMGRREAVARMLARLRAQHRQIVRSRSGARLLALRLRRLRYLRAQAAARHSSHHSAPPAGRSGRTAVLVAIRKALDIKGIKDPAARARWTRGMDLVARRESDYNAHAINNWDSNAARGTPSKGAWQFIAPTFARYHQRGTSANIHNLVAQACAFINYARGHYGVAADASNLADRIQQADPRRSPRGY